MLSSLFSSRRLARLFSSMSVTPLLCGCLVDDPPAYTAPQQTAPRLLGTRATPPLDEVITTKQGDAVEFTVPVMSEDAGERLVAKLLFDYDDMGAEIATDTQLPPSTLDEGERTLHLVWSVRSGITAGCHRLTLRVTHGSNFTNGPEVIDRADTDEVYWFANINVTPQNINSLVGCPRASLPGSAR